MRKFNLTAATALLLATSLGCAEVPVTGVVNFSSCISESKTGKKEQENMEGLRNQMQAAIGDTQNRLKELSAKFEDAEFLDSLSPKAEEEMKAEFQKLQDDLGMYQQQFYQMLNQAHYQMMQRMNGAIAKAAEKVATEKGFDQIANREVFFYIHPRFDVTQVVISEMDQTFELEAKAAVVTDAAAPAAPESAE